MKIGFYSCMSGMAWGGSEVLWQRSAKQLIHAGHEVAVNFKYWPYKAEPLKWIEENGGSVFYRDKPSQSGIRSWFVAEKKEPNWLDHHKPDAVLITLGYHPDEIWIADQCRERNIPYSINLQCASNSFFIHGDRIDDFRRWYRHAERVMFVSNENRNKLENNIAMTLDNAEIVANPFNVAPDANPEWPETDGEYRLGFVGRIHFQSKGHDLLVDVLKQDKWKDRNLKVSFYGHDQGNKRQLTELTHLYGLEDKLEFAGYTSGVEGIWAQNHGLILPSRYEGAPLVVIEAMLCHRFAISTDIGRNVELIDDNETGFIAPAPTIELLDEAMERAWAKRDQWREMGQLAGQRIRERYPSDPVSEYTDKITSMVVGSNSTARQEENVS